MLLEQFLELIREGWGEVFAQERTTIRATEHAIGMICAFGRRTISRAICAIGRMHQDWSADYKIFSRSAWDEDELFNPVIVEYVRRYPEGPINVACDDTGLPKSGKKIKTASWQRDPMSPPFHVNLRWGLRFAQASILFPHYREGNYGARGVPVCFKEAPAVKKPGKLATPEQKEAYKKLKKEQNLSKHFLGVLTNLRKRFDTHGAAGRTIVAAVDGSLCNKTIFKAVLDRIELAARCRRDAKLCFPAPAGSRRKYGERKLTPEKIRADKTIKWKKARINFGGAWRDIRYKEVNNVLWQRGAGRRLLRCFVIAPQPYKLSPNSRTNYRDPAYLLSTDMKTKSASLIQAYFDRWQIEVNHREEKSILGVGEAQVSSEKSVSRHPSFVVAAYAMLLLASIKSFGPGRTDDYHALPKWRKHARRPSILDLMTLIRKEISETPVSELINKNFMENAATYAYT